MITDMWNETFDSPRKQGLERLTGGNKYRYYCNERVTDDGMYIYDVYEYDGKVTVKEVVIGLIDEYDGSEAVNSFVYGGVKMWIPKELRISLMNSSTIEAASGKTETVLWYNGVRFEMPIATLQGLLSAIELYALECYNVTAAHKAAVMAMSDDDAVRYDYTQGYPEMLRF